MLKEEKEDSVAPELPELNTEAEADVDGEELDSSDMSAIIYEIPKEPEKWVLGWMGGTKGKEQLQAYSPLGTDPDATGSFLSRRRRSKRSRVMDADGLLEMFHCPYEGCSQVYVALSSFQVRPPPGRPVAKSSWPGSCGCMWLYWVSVAQGLRPGTHFVPTGLAGHLAFSALSLSADIRHSCLVLPAPQTTLLVFHRKTTEVPGVSHTWEPQILIQLELFSCSLPSQCG